VSTAVSAFALGIRGRTLTKVPAGTPKCIDFQPSRAHTAYPDHSTTSVAVKTTRGVFNRRQAQAHHSADAMVLSQPLYALSPDPHSHSLTHSQVALQARPEALPRLGCSPSPLARPSPLHPLSFRSQPPHLRTQTTTGDYGRRLPTPEQETDECVQAIYKETLAILEEWKHPDPYRPPTAPGGMLICDVENVR
jgi:hypothetical protein